MAYILGLIVVALFFLALHYFTELEKKQKISISAAVLSVVFGATAYNSYSLSQQEKILSVAKAYNQGKTVICNNKEINATLYSLSIGTYTFIGKENTPLYGEMIDVAECSLKEN